LDAKILQKIQKLRRLAQVYADAAAIAAEGITIGQCWLHRDADAVGAGAKRHKVVDADTYGDLESWGFGTDSGNHCGKNPRSILQVAAVASGPIDGGQELVAETAVAVLHVHKCKPGPLCQPGRTYEIGY